MEYSKIVTFEKALERFLSVVPQIIVGGGYTPPKTKTTRTVVFEQWDTDQEYSNDKGTSYSTGGERGAKITDLHGNILAEWVEEIRGGRGL